MKYADAKSFVVLDEGVFVNEWGLHSYQGYARDCNHVYYYVDTIGKPRIVKGADLTSFRVLKFCFAADESLVYYEGVPLKKAKPDSIKILGRMYAKDERHVYYGSTLIKHADPTSFEIIDESEMLSRDSQNEYERDEIKI